MTFITSPLINKAFDSAWADWFAQSRLLDRSFHLMVEQMDSFTNCQLFQKKFLQQTKRYEKNCIINWRRRILKESQKILSAGESKDFFFWIGIWEQSLNAFQFRQESKSKLQESLSIESIEMSKRNVWGFLGGFHGKKNSKESSAPTFLKSRDHKESLRIFGQRRGSGDPKESPRIPRRSEASRQMSGKGSAENPQKRKEAPIGRNLQLQTKPFHLIVIH